MYYMGMTLSLRNTILLAEIVGAALFLCLALAAFFVPLSGGETGLPIVQFEREWRELFPGTSDHFFPWLLGRSIGVGLFSVIASITLRSFFRKTVSQEMFFFINFTVFLCLENVRIFQLVLITLPVSPYFGSLLTRLVYFGFFLEVSCIFFASIYALGVEYQKLGTILGINLLVSFVLAASLPVDVTSLRPDLLFEIGYSRGILIIFLCIQAFTIVNYLRASQLRVSRDYAIMGAAMVAVMTGRTLLFYLFQPVWILLGFGLLAAGTAVFARKTHDLYLWL